MAKTNLSFEALKPEYETLWETMVIKPEWQDAIDRRARLIISNKSRYQEVEDATGVPWCIVGVIHSLEGSNNFGTHLHNGDPLSRRTVNVPAGRPKSGQGPFTWVESAIDAIKYDGLDKIVDWSPANMAYALEKFNGFGYRTRRTGVNSPYLWSGTNHYTIGKFVKDGSYVKSAKSAQAGCMPILKRISELDVTKKEVIQASRKGSFLSGVKKFLVTGVATVTSIDYLEIGGQYWAQIKDIVSNHGLLTLAISGGVIVLVAHIFQQMMYGEYKNGDYTPSKFKIPAADGEDGKGGTI